MSRFSRQKKTDELNIITGSLLRSEHIAVKKLTNRAKKVPTDARRAIAYDQI